MNNGLLPIGSIVLLKNAKSKIVICGYKISNIDEPDKIYDYIGFPYPEGFISRDYSFLFNADKIENVYFKGYIDEEQKKFINLLEEELNGK